MLVEPEIPANTGNISRLCAVTGIPLHLVRPLGFCVDDRHLKRAGLDYWDQLDLHYHDSLDEVLALYPDYARFFLTSHTETSYATAVFPERSLLIFGKESVGLAEDIRSRFAEDCVRIPMVAGARCLNLSNSVAIVVYEALRQQGRLQRGYL